MREVIVQWSISPIGWGVTDFDYAIGISKRIGATAVQLLYDHDWEISPEPPYSGFDRALLDKAINRYTSAGFKLYLSFWDEKIPAPSEIEHLLIDGISGIALDSPTELDPTIAQPDLITLSGFCRSKGKTLTYYHADGLKKMDPVVLSSAGVTVAINYEPIIVGRWGPPSPTWDATKWYNAWKQHPLWAFCFVWNRDPYYSRQEDLQSFYGTVVANANPDAILWWQTTCNFKPTEEQINAMQGITTKFLTPIPPIKPLIVNIGGPLLTGLLLWGLSRYRYT